MSEIRKHFLLLYLIATFIFPLFIVHADGDITGKIIDASSTIPMANIKLVLVGAFSQETMTNKEGFYQFLHVPSGQYELQVEPPTGYVETSKNPLSLNVLSSEVKANFYLGIPGNIEGCVIDANTQLPIANVNVDVMLGNKIIVSVLTDDNGIYTVYELAPRPYIFRVKMPDFQSSLQLVIPISHQTIITDFSLKCLPCKVNGTIMNAITGQPISNAKVDILEKGLTIESIQSNEDGSYTISELIPAHYQMKVFADEYQTITQNISLIANQTLTADFTLQPFGIIHGQVLHAFTGNPILGACVGFWQNDALFTFTHTDENGSFSVKGLEHFQVVVQLPNFHDSEQGVDILPNQTVMMDFNLVCLEPHPPSKIIIETIHKRLNHRVDCIHRLQWKPSPSQSVVSYHIYRDEKLIAKIPASSPLIYNDEWRSEKIKNYHIVAVNHFGQESKRLSIIAKPPRS